ncbi:MAG TPA: DUF6364 family protein [Candidatus Dormibacteraeota bacterium]|nr:DUF6364 family protein [Candidatus Dormibacteraeota bacterium]
MKNVTISLEEQVARWARVAAARQNISLSRLVSRLLEEQMRLDEEYETAKHRFLSRSARLSKAPGDRYPTREEIYDDALLRRHQRPDLFPR